MIHTNEYLKDKNHKAKIRAEFAHKLTCLLIEREQYSARTSQIADPKFLAKLLNCSVVMARRYLLGQSIPDKPKLQKIAEWANVEVSWLLSGNNKTENGTTTTNGSLMDKNIWIKILNQLRPYLLNPTLTNNSFENYISFAIDIYENIYHLDIDLSDKVKMIELMVKSIEFSKDKKNKSIAVI